ncbi:MAG: hypothetical protein JST96_10275 [Bacteroidetes bacterium]|nr:hypothetical protein [Bacteroidota bacterium]
MKQHLLVFFLFAIFLQFTPIHASAQDSSAKKEIDELRLKLNADGTHYIKLVLLGQLWLRLNQNNPASTVLKQPANETFDIGIRRLRFQLFGQITDHTFFYLHFGQDNFNFLSQRKFASFIQDALVEFKIKKGSEAFILGGGLTIANGLSRFTQPQLVNIVSTDIPVFTLPTFDLTDQAGRKLSVLARGQIGHLDYRAILSNPFPVTTSSPAPPTGNPVSPNASFAQQGHSLQYSGLFIWNFLDREPHVILFMPGTYYGKKNVLNLEAGFISQKNATWYSKDSGRTVDYHLLNCWSVAIFYDAPLNKQTGTALNAYLGYFNYDYGHGYLRYVGVMNPADGLASANYIAGSQGNAFPMFGTGNIFYAQVGYLCRKDLFGNQVGTLMPYATLQTAMYDRLDKRMSVLDLGINWFVKNNTSKISFDYQNRPVYHLQNADLIRESGRKGQFVLQYQFFF